MKALNSLWVRLTLTFTLVILLVVAAIALLINRTTNAEFRHYITELEQSFTGEPYDEPIEGPVEDFVRDAEEFLRRQRENGSNGGST